MIDENAKSPTHPLSTFLNGVADVIAPAIVHKPPLTRWLCERDMSIRDGAAFFDTTPETLRRAVLPYGHRNARPPYRELMRRIIQKTDGAIRPDDWYEECAEAAA